MKIMSYGGSINIVDSSDGNVQLTRHLRALYLLNLYQL